MGVLCLFASSYVYAGCDTCIQGSVEKASASIQSSLSALKTSTESNITATNTLKATIDTSNSTMVGLLNAQQQEMLTALDGVAAKLSLSQDQLRKTVVNLTDYAANEISLAIKNQTKLKAFAENSLQYGPLAHPISSDIATNRAPLLRDALFEKAELLDNNIIKFQQWAMIVDDVSTETLRGKLVDEKIEELTPLLSQLNSTVITREDSSNLLVLLRLLTLPKPLAFNTLDSQEKIEYLLRVESLTNSYKALAEDVLDRTALLPVEGWDIGYTQIKVLEDSTSILEFIASETTRKLFAESWHLDIKKMTEAGLLREQLNQVNITNYLLNELIEQERTALAIEVSLD